ncbi:DUF6807 family protein [Thalassoglobus sp. JC818]|uniref:DUF6807 family protein n=1 Tax=Thalassoglobus sp. JC818 TaxID=3232136 RepID=UPI003458FB0F
MIDQPETNVSKCRDLSITVLLLGLGMILLSTSVDGQDAAATLKFRDSDVVIRAGANEIARYVFKDQEIPRPYLCDVKAPTQFQVTRRHPPIPDVDATDHATMHPGIWLAFGDLSGSDFWRNKATIQHVEFLANPQHEDEPETLRERKLYLSKDGEVLCEEEFSLRVIVKDSGYLFEFDSIFTSDREFSFGDQEEMGLGVRAATQLAENAGGRMKSSRGLESAKAIWGQPAEWCELSRVIENDKVGFAIFCHRDNLRSSWMHARDYGLMTANLFGREAMKQGERSRIVVMPEEEFRLRYAVFVYAVKSDQTVDVERIYQDYLERN